MKNVNLQSLIYQGAETGLPSQKHGLMIVYLNLLKAGVS